MGKIFRDGKKTKKLSLKEKVKHTKDLYVEKQKTAPLVAREFADTKTKEWDDKIDAWKTRHKILGKLLLFWHSTPT